VIGTRSVGRVVQSPLQDVGVRGQVGKEVISRLQDKVGLVVQDRSRTSIYHPVFSDIRDQAKRMTAI
jgi:hypothetical protein